MNNQNESTGNNENRFRQDGDGAQDFNKTDQNREGQPLSGSNNMGHLNQNQSGSTNPSSNMEDGSQDFNNKDQNRNWQDQGNPNPGSDIVGDGQFQNDQNSVRNGNMQDRYGDATDSDTNMNSDSDMDYDDINEETDEESDARRNSSTDTQRDDTII